MAAAALCTNVRDYRGSSVPATTGNRHRMNQKFPLAEQRASSPKSRSYGGVRHTLETQL